MSNSDLITPMVYVKTEVVPTPRREQSEVEFQRHVKGQLSAALKNKDFGKVSLALRMVYRRIELLGEKYE